MNQLFFGSLFTMTGSSLPAIQKLVSVHILENFFNVFSKPAREMKLEFFKVNLLYTLWIRFTFTLILNFNVQAGNEESCIFEFEKSADHSIHQFSPDSSAREIQKALNYEEDRYWPMEWFMVGVKVSLLNSNLDIFYKLISTSHCISNINQTEEVIHVKEYAYTPTMKIAAMHIDEIKGANVGVVIIGNTPVNFLHEDLRQRFKFDSPTFSMHPKPSKVEKIFNFKRKNVHICLPKTLSSAVAGIIGMTDLNSVGGVGIAPRCFLGHFVIDPFLKKGSPEYCVHGSISKNAIVAIDVFIHAWVLPFHDPLSNILRAWGDKNLLNYRHDHHLLKPQVMGSGNFGLFANSCQCNEYANVDSMFVFGSIAYNNFITSYSETCASLIGVTYSTSEGKEYYNNIITISAYNNNLLQYAPKSTAAISAAIGGGIIALMTDIFKKKFQRAPTVADVAFLLAFSSNSYCLENKNMMWFTNGVRLRYSPQAGFGLPNMDNVRNLINDWTPLGIPIIFETTRFDRKSLTFMNGFECSFNIAKPVTHNYILSVNVEINVKLVKRGALSVYLISPAGTVSCILEGRPYDIRSKNYDKLYLRSYHFLGEKLEGKWEIRFYTYKEDSKPTFNERFSFPTGSEPNAELSGNEKPPNDSENRIESGPTTADGNSSQKVAENLIVDEVASVADPVSQGQHQPTSSKTDFHPSNGAAPNSNTLTQKYFKSKNSSTQDKTSIICSEATDSNFDSSTSCDITVDSPKRLVTQFSKNEFPPDFISNNINQNSTPEKFGEERDPLHSEQNKSSNLGSMTDKPNPASTGSKENPINSKHSIHKINFVVNQVKFRALLVDSLPTVLTLEHKEKNQRQIEADFYLLKSWVDFRHFLLTQTDPLNYGKSSISMSEVYDLLNYFIIKLTKIQTVLKENNLSKPLSLRIRNSIDEIIASNLLPNTLKKNEKSLDSNQLLLITHGEEEKPEQTQSSLRPNSFHKQESESVLTNQDKAHTSEVGVASSLPGENHLAEFFLK